MPSLRLPIFPLSIVLFPGTPQFLHIFEERYRQLLADCLAGDQVFGISFVAPAGGPDPQPAPGDVGCSALVQGTRRLPDGRSNVLATGGDRYALQHYVDADVPYLVAMVETFDDLDRDAPELPELASGVRAKFLKFVEGMQTLNDQRAPLPALDDDPTDLSFQVSAGVDVDSAVKQELLAMRSTHDRLGRLDAMLEQFLGEVTRRAVVHVRARRNGRGGHDPDIVSSA